MTIIFPYIAIFSIIVLIIISFLSIKKKKSIVNLMMNILTFVWLIWLIFLWIKIERAPIRTLRETRMWYAILTPIISWALYNKYEWKWILPYSSILSIVFFIVNILHPENFDKELLPALQSIWFVPHVLVYMLSYAMFGVATIISVYELWFYNNTNVQKLNKSTFVLINTGFAFLTLGLLFGAIWAKDAWGHYWTWDPKEVWALITWFIYLLYLHFVRRNKYSKTNAIFLVIAFFILLICWFGVNYLPIANQSIHTY